MEEKTKLLWKTIPRNFESRGHKWKIGKWCHVGGAIELCKNGFHASPTILDAMAYVSAGWICRVKVRGNCYMGNDKSAWSDMIIVKRYKWTKKMSLALAIYAAELVLPIFEKEYPEDMRPRDAIAAAKAYLKRPCIKTKTAAYAAYTAAYAAADAAAYAAARAAYAAADAADAAAAAAYAAYTAAAAAAAADAAAATDAAADAPDAARAAILKNIERKIKQLAGMAK